MKKNFKSPKWRLFLYELYQPDVTGHFFPVRELHHNSWKG
ncbi:hypothetical protein EFW58_00934 [Bacillus velezensis]|nr:hypothetical protein EFW58_00934 [Bacillus velezensis]